MLWSLIKFILFIGIVAAATLGAGYLMEMDGGVRVAIANMEFNLGPVQAVVAAVVLLIVLWIVLKLASLGVAVLKFLNGDETAISRWFDRNRERKGFEALSDGMMALASGEARVAMSKATKAERYLKRPELTNLIAAQAAEMVGDRAKAEEVYKRLLKDDRTRFVGIRGIMKQKLAEGDTEVALRLAEKAFALKPRHEETQDVLLRLQANEHDWKGARKTLGTKLKHGALPRAVHRRRDAVLALGEARDIVDEDKTIEAREAAIEANRLSPDLVPAAVMAARAYVARDQRRYATRVIKKAWVAAPHPDLAAAYAEIEADETPEARIKRFRSLVKPNPNHSESRLVMAELHISAEDYSGARKALGDLPETTPNARVLSILAAIERGEGAPDRAVRALLTRALYAPRGPQWVCDNCQNIPGEWEPVCSNCGAFDTLSWREPPEADQGVVRDTMMPLLVGEEETVPDADVVEDEVVETEASGEAPAESEDDRQNDEPVPEGTKN